MRLFVALDIPEELAAELGSLQEELATLPSLRFVNPRKIHLTLKYLGEVAEEKLPKVAEALAAIPFSTLKLQTTKLGSFPHVFWLGIKLNKELAQLQQHVQRAVRPWAMHDPRPYKAHLTIARFQQLSDEEGAILDELTTKRIAHKWKAERFTLYSSTLTPNGPVYEAVASFAGNNSNIENN